MAPNPALSLYGLPVSGDADHYQTGVGLAQVLVPEPPAFHGAGPEVLDQHVSSGDELAGEFLSFFLPQVQRDGLLVARDDRPPQGTALLAVPPPLAHGIALAGWLDFYDLGPEVS
jgi:hypothetical protein